MSYPAGYVGHKFNGNSSTCTRCGGTFNNQPSYDAHYTIGGFCQRARPGEETIAQHIARHFPASKTAVLAKPTKVIHGLDEYPLGTCTICKRDNQMLSSGVKTTIGKSVVQLVDPNTCRLCVSTMSSELEAIASRMVVAWTRGNRK